MVRGSERRELLISKGWVQAVALVVLFGFFVLGLLAYRAYSGQPPIPDRVVDPQGEVVFTGEDVRAGQGVFLRNGLMQYGSIFGHGAYLGPDFTADYLRRSALYVRESYGGGGSDRATVQTIEDFKENRYDPQARTLQFTAPQAAAFEELREHYGRYFGEPTTKYGLRPEAISDPGEIKQLTAYFAWTAWAASALRPGTDYTYTNNWPPEPLVENEPTANIVVWSVLSLIALLGGIGLLFAAFGRWNFLGWRGREQATLSFRSPGDVALTPAQRACAWFFIVMAALFLVQTLVGAASQHYRADLASFFGIDLAQYLPYNLMRTWHVQLAIFWVATSFLAAGIFLAPMIAGREPQGQRLLAFGLLGALAIVVFGSLIGEWAGIFGLTGDLWAWFGNQGFEYLDLGRFWQVLLSIGLFFWVVMLFRAMRGRLRREHMGNMPWLFFFAALAIPAFYAVGLLARPDSHFTTADFWRFWVVHLWVEDFLELFTTVMVAYIFVLLGVVREKVALTVIYLDILLYSAGGVIGTMHHLYFSGTPAEHMALGAFFSAAEVIPLDLPDRRGLELFAARGQAGVTLSHALPASLGRDVPRGGGFLELPRGRDLRLPHKPADHLLLPDRHCPDRQPWPRGDDGGLRDACSGARAVLPALPDPGGALVGAGGQDKLLVAEHRARLDVLRYALPFGHPAALPVGERRLLRGPHAGVPDQRDERPPGVDSSAGGRGLHRRRRAAAVVPLLPRRAPHRPARSCGGA